MELNDLEDHVIRVTINQLPALYQVAVSRVCKLFEDNALKDTPILDVYDIPDEYRLDVAKKMPMLTIITGLEREVSEIKFIRDVAAINKNIVSLDGCYGLEGYAYEYVKAVKELDSSYIGSNFNYLVTYSDHRMLIRKYPEMKIKCDRGDFDSQFDPESDTFVRKLRVESSEFIKNIFIIYPNLTHLVITIKPERKDFKMSTTLESLSKLPLKELTFIFDEFKGEYENQNVDKFYTMTAEDYSCLQKVFNILSIRFIYLYLNACRPDTKAIYESFIGCANNQYSLIRIQYYDYVAMGCCSTRFFSSRYNRGYHHIIRIELIPGFFITNFIQKFKRTPARCFDISGASDEKWNEMKEQCQKFAKERPDYRFTLSRTKGNNSCEEFDGIYYNY